MSLVAFLSQAAFISLSGVVSPGPITAVVTSKGSTSPHAGALVAVGHALVEFPLIALIAWGFGSLFSQTYVKAGIALIGGVLLFLMGIDMFRSLKKACQVSRQDARSPIIAGVLLSAGNPFFLIWWATVGLALIVRALEFGLGGLLALAVVHWSCDLAWCYFLSALSFKGGQFFGKRFQEIVFVLCGVFLIFFGAKFVLDAVSGLVA